MAKVINLHDTAGVLPKGAVRVDERTKWGNPWWIGERHSADGHKLTRNEVIQMHRHALPQMLAALRDDGIPILDLRELRGKDLACWCAPLPCHADVLLELANQGQEGE